MGLTCIDKGKIVAVKSKVKWNCLKSVNKQNNIGNRTDVHSD